MQWFRLEPQTQIESLFIIPDPLKSSLWVSLQEYWIQREPEAIQKSNKDRQSNLLLSRNAQRPEDFWNALADVNKFGTLSSQ